MGASRSLEANEGGLTPAQLEAARLLAEGRLRLPEIAKAVDYSENTLWKWRKDAAFQAEVREQIQLREVEVFGAGLARRHNRVRALDRLAQKVEAKLEHKVTIEYAYLYRGLLDDIAREMGHRASRFEIDADIHNTEHVGPPTVLSFEHQESLPTDPNVVG